MNVENRFQAIAADPVQRVIRVHSDSQANSLRHRRCDETVAPASREADAGQARIIINALRREIDRLMRGIDRHCWCGTCCRPAISSPSNRLSTDDSMSSRSALELTKLASPSAKRKLYAGPALGAPLAPATATSLYASGGRQLHATATPVKGALIDVIA